MNEVHGPASVTLTWRKQSDLSDGLIMGEFCLVFLCQCGKSLASHSFSGATSLEGLVAWAETVMSAASVVSIPTDDRGPWQGKCSN